MGRALGGNREREGTEKRVRMEGTGEEMDTQERIRKKGPVGGRTECIGGEEVGSKSMPEEKSWTDFMMSCGPSL